jgi:MoaA/NifB/PqqE/SkfB family radical SAM enzyme
MQKKDKSEVTKVYFEVTNSCNFRCDFCPSYLSERKRQHMDFALFEKGIDDIIRDGITDTVGFHILGEPLLYPRLEDAVRYAKRRGCGRRSTRMGRC